MLATQLSLIHFCQKIDTFHISSNQCTNISYCLSSYDVDFTQFMLNYFWLVFIYYFQIHLSFVYINVTIILSTSILCNAFIYFTLIISSHYLLQIFTHFTILSSLNFTKDYLIVLLLKSYYLTLLQVFLFCLLTTES